MRNARSVNLLRDCRGNVLQQGARVILMAIHQTALPPVCQLRWSDRNMDTQMNKHFPVMLCLASVRYTLITLGDEMQHASFLEGANGVYTEFPDDVSTVSKIPAYAEAGIALGVDANEVSQYLPNHRGLYVKSGLYFS